MPVVFRYKGIRYIFYSNEGDPREAAHIHAESSEGKAKFWLRPDVVIAGSGGFTRKQLSEMIEVVKLHREEIERAWNEHFS